MQNISTALHSTHIVSCRHAVNSPPAVAYLSAFCVPFVDSNFQHRVREDGNTGSLCSKIKPSWRAFKVYSLTFATARIFWLGRSHPVEHSCLACRIPHSRRVRARAVCYSYSPASTNQFIGYVDSLEFFTSAVARKLLGCHAQMTEHEARCAAGRIGVLSCALCAGR